MNARIRFVDNKDGKHIIAIETKYTDMLGVNETRHCDEQKQMLVNTGLFSANFEEMLMGGKVKLSQIYRNLLLTERYRMVEGLKDSYSVDLSPKEHPSNEKEIKAKSRASQVLQGVHGFFGFGIPAVGVDNPRLNRSLDPDRLFDVSEHEVHRRRTAFAEIPGRVREFEGATRLDGG